MKRKQRAFRKDGKHFTQPIFRFNAGRRAMVKASRKRNRTN
jgi:hypothetical protein